MSNFGIIKKYFTGLALILLILSLGCGKKRTSTVIETKITPPAPITALPEKKEKIKYKYTGELYADPFVALAERKVISPLLKDKGEAAMPNVGALSLKGIITDNRTRIALLSSPTGSYIAKNGKLYDNRNRVVRGIETFVEEKSVKITTEEKFSRVLKFKGSKDIQ